MVVAGLLLSPMCPSIGAGLINSGVTMGMKAVTALFTHQQLTMGDVVKTGVSAFAAGLFGGLIQKGLVAIGGKGLMVPIASAVGDMATEAVFQYLMTGKVNPKEVIVSGLTSFVTSGGLKQTAKAVSSIGGKADNIAYAGAKAGKTVQSAAGDVAGAVDGYADDAGRAAKSSLDSTPGGAGVDGGMRKTTGGMCFTGETLVKTEGGHKQIGDIEVGDKVYSENVVTGEKGYKTVKQIFINNAYTLLHISVNDTEIITTFPHPFYVIGKGWVEAKDLKVGDVLKLANGETTAVKSLSVEKLNAPVKVYNFEVEDWHTYYVSEYDVLVHNTGSNPCAQEVPTEGFDNWLNKGDADNKVYFGIKNGKEVYTGITKQELTKRLYQHNYKGKGFENLVEQVNGLTRNQARAIEQYLIENGTANAMNQINSISPSSHFYEEALQWAENFIKNIK